MWIVSFICLSLTALICAIGVFHVSFKDNLLQCIGMSGLCIADIGRANAVWSTEYVAASWLLVHLFVCVYAVGTVLKVLVINGRAAGWPWILKHDRWIAWRKSVRGDFDSKPHHWGTPR